MKVLVAGASGLVGRELIKLLTQNNIPWVGSYNSNPCIDCFKLDFQNEVEVNLFCEINKITICINCIGERNVDLCETDWNHANFINIKIVENIAKVCNKLNIFLIHISTDYLFDGTNQPNLPESQVNPLQNYGISKLIAECKIKALCKGNSLIIRVPVLYTDNITKLDETVIGLIIKKVLNIVEPSYEDNFNIRRPLFIKDLCYFIYNNILKQQIGIVHFYNPYDSLTKFEIAKFIADYLKKPMIIKPIISTLNTQRPYDTQLEDRTYNIKNYNITTLKDGISNCLINLYHPPISFNKLSDESIFLLIDLDGTLIDTDNLHYHAYKKSCDEFNINITYEEYMNTRNINDFIKTKSNKFNLIKQRKIQLIKETASIKFIDGAEELINWINLFNINHAVVTNTGIITVDYFKSQLPKLKLLKNWITREDTKFGKPDPEPYLKAITKYYNGEKYKIGIENSITGLEAIKHVTKCIYIITNNEHIHYNQFKKEDVYLIPNLTYLNTNII